MSAATAVLTTKTAEVATLTNDELRDTIVAMAAHWTVQAAALVEEMEVVPHGTRRNVVMTEETAGTRESGDGIQAETEMIAGLVIDTTPTGAYLIIPCSTSQSAPLESGCSAVLGLT